MFSQFLLVVVAGAAACGAVPIAEWRPVEGTLLTRWGKEVSPQSVHPEYPRPQMTRKEWRNLNGLWDYAVLPRDEDGLGRFEKGSQGRILVPFAVESALSGVKKAVGPESRLWYRRAFDVPAAWRGQRVLLHFGAVDWEATVWVNGTKVGEHRGGYDPFALDVTKALKPEGPQEVVVAVWDPTDTNWQPRGKQVLNPSGIWYTAVTGIWQTVWLEPVPTAAIASLKIVPDVDRSTVSVEVRASGDDESGELSVSATAMDGKRVVARAQGPAGKPLVLSVEGAKLWSPDGPFLYGLTVSLAKESKQVDEVESYFGMRKISVGKDGRGINRLMLNGRPLFQYGPLDQGWWPDGLYTAPSDAALRYDLEVTKRIGMNMVRKHVKVEPARWYYHCDRLGLLVWQDMPNGDRGIGPKDPDLARSKESAENYVAELGAIMDAVGNSPSVVAWVPFNEGWGQFDTARIAKWIKDCDPGRLVNATTGWTDRGVGDFHDMHSYPGPGMFPAEGSRASVLGEFGGLGLPLMGHLWRAEKNWGYRNIKDRTELTKAYGELMAKLRPLVEKGLAAAVYTQTTDVEREVNGLMTYDREILKMDAAELKKVHEGLYAPVDIGSTEE